MLQKNIKKNGVDIKVLDNVSYKFFDKKFYSIMGAVEMENQR